MSYLTNQLRWISSLTVTITPVQKKGNTMLIVAIDYHSNWVELKAVRAATAEKTAEFVLSNFICRHGAFSELVCDRWSQFTLGLMSEFINLFNGKVVCISTYQPAVMGVQNAWSKR
jgi:hypothetical protein